MKRICVLLISLCLLLLTTGICMAGSWQLMNGDATIEKGTVINGDLLFSGERLEVDGEIKGDLVVWSGEVVMNGRIEGSILGAVWDRLVVNGEVLGNIRGFTGDMRINGRINGSITTAAVLLNTSRHSVIGQGILGVFSNVNLQGTVNGDVDLKSAPLTRIGGRINGNLKVEGAPVIWQAPLVISGNVNDYSGVARDPSKIKGIALQGNYLLHQPHVDFAASSGVITLISIVWFIGSLLASLILYRLFPRTMWTITEPSRINFRRNMLAGLISLVCIPIAILILTITLVGIPLAILLGLIYMILLLFFGIPVNLWFGRLLFKSRLHPSLMIILAGIILMLISFIPVINMAVFLILLVLGMGTIVGNIRPQIFERNKLDLKV
jgi:cytoskeletal protein CcmA (bactofilin family)